MKSSRVAFAAAVLVMALQSALPARGDDKRVEESAAAMMSRRLPYTYLADYGVVCDGATDNASAIARAITARPGTAMIWPAGHCRWSGTITLKGTGTQWIGQGRMVTFLEPTSATGDEVFVGDDAKPETTVATYNYVFRDFTIFPAVTKTSGYTFHLQNVLDVLFENVDTNNDLLYAYGGGNRHYNGVFADHSNLHLENVQVRAQQDGLRLAHSVDTLIHLTNLRFSRTALHFAGGVAGFTCSQSTMSESLNNFRVDNNDDPATPNKGATFGEGCYFDTSTADNIVIDTPLGGLNQWQWVGSSIATQGGNAVHVVSAPNSSVLVFTNTFIGSTSAGTHSGIRIDDPSAQIVINGHTAITANTAYGIEQTYPRAYPNPVTISTDTLWTLGEVRGNQIANTNFPYNKTLTMVGKSIDGATAAMTVDGKGKPTPATMIWLPDEASLSYDIQVNCRSATTADFAYWHVGGYATRAKGPASFAIRHTTDNGGTGRHGQMAASPVGQGWTLGIGNDSRNGGMAFTMAGSKGLSVTCTAQVSTVEN
ncbi:MAG: glycosyl hydrolase family 28-related protein [Azospirillaceae bacterium]|nr:glycosyl hydrolase family 28-related protein [Azospirillaceae bacterium]